MKKKILLSSIVTIALCLCMIAGSTFALFTDTSETMNVTVNSGKVDISASISDALIYSSIEIVGADVAVNKNGDVRKGYHAHLDPNLDETFYYKNVEGLSALPNGGTAAFVTDPDGNNVGLTLTNITPGDKVEFTVEGTSASNVHTNVRLVASGITSTTNDHLVDQTDTVAELPSYLEMYIVDEDDNRYDIKFDGTDCVSEWLFLDKDDNSFSYTVFVGLPVDAGNDCQNESISFNIVLQAVQANEEAPSNNGTVNP